MTDRRDSADPLEPRVTAAIGEQYTLEGKIGQGGMAAVYRARDRRLGRVVAVKVLPPELAYDPAIRTRFMREAQTSARLSHAHIVPIYDVGEREGIAYFVMALIPGGNLAELLAREPRQPVEEARRLLREIADALAYAHERGVIHRDIKPDNILLDQDRGRAMVTDFGIARAVEAGTRLTVTGAAVGTPTYMSPEQAMGDRDVDGRSDVYALGVLGYQMLTGRVPFAAANPMALLLKHVGERPRAIAELRPDAPAPLREAIERALMKAPEDRWPTALAMRDALAGAFAPLAWRAEQPQPVRYVSPRPASRTSPSRATPPPAGGPPAAEPEYIARLTGEQREDLRLWDGRTSLLSRIKAIRRYGWYTLFMSVGGLMAFVGGLSEGIPPLVFAPIVPGYMWLKLVRRGRSLRQSGLRLRRVFLMPTARRALPPAAVTPGAAPDGPDSPALRRAAEDRAAILQIVNQLSTADRALLPDVAPTVDALVRRVTDLEEMVARLDQSIDPSLRASLEQRVARLEGEPRSDERNRRLELVRRQQATLRDLLDRRDTLGGQLESALLALGSLRLDLIRLRSSGLQAGGGAALSGVASATQQAKALSREIGAALDAVAEVESL